MFDNLLKEINSGKVESLTRGLDPKMLHPSSSSGPRSRIQSRRTISTTSNVSTSSELPKQSRTQRAAFANELQSVLKKNIPQVSESTEIEECPVEKPLEKSEPYDIDELPEVSPEAKAKPRTESDKSEESGVRVQKSPKALIRNGSIPKRKELKEVSTQTFEPRLQEEIKEDIPEPTQRYSNVTL